MRHIGNVERYLSYKKLHRTGRLLRGLKVKRSGSGYSRQITLYNDVPYASEHETGSVTPKATIKSPYVHNGAQGVVTGGDVEARPSMQPSAQVLKSPYKLLGAKMKSFGW